MNSERGIQTNPICSERGIQTDTERGIQTDPHHHITTRSSAALDSLAAIARQNWREHAACAGAYAVGDEFVDVIDNDTARDLITRYCHRCTVVGACREEADRGAPYKLHDYVAGARHYGKGEPLNGWEVAS